MRKIISVAVLIICSLSINAQDITDGLIYNYSFSGNANDSGPLGMDGEITNVEFGDGPGTLNSEAAYFNGINSVITFPQNENIEVQYPFSISFWVKRSSFSPGVFTLDDWVDHHSGIWVSTSSTNKLAINHGDGGGPNSGSRRTYLTEHVLQLDVWYSVVAVVESYNDWTVWVNCAEVEGSFSGSSSSNISWNQTYGAGFGRKDALTNQPWHYFGGALDEMRMWNRVLTEQEVQLLCDPDFGFYCYGDLNFDGVVSVPDLFIFLSTLDCTENCVDIDFNNDENVDIMDVLLFLEVYATYCNVE